MRYQLPRTLVPSDRKFHQGFIAILGSLVVLSVFMLVFGVTTPMAQTGQVTICHIPPDDPDNFQTMVVSENAEQSHLDHGDLLGSCLSNCETLYDDGNACTEDRCDPNNEHRLAEHPPVTCESGELCEDTSGECVVVPSGGSTQCPHLDGTGNLTTRALPCTGPCPAPMNDGVLVCTCINGQWSWRRQM